MGPLRGGNEGFGGGESVEELPRSTGAFAAFKLESGFGGDGGTIPVQVEGAVGPLSGREVVRVCPGYLSYDHVGFDKDFLR